MSDNLRIVLIFAIAWIAIILISIFGCNIDYDVDREVTYHRIIGTPCDHEGDKARYAQGDLELCVICQESADGLVWFKMSCEEFEDESKM